MTPNPQQSIRKAVQALVAEYEKADPNMNEHNVEAAFVARLFEILGWEMRPTVWNRQKFIRDAGFADVAVQIDNQPVLFIETKRFGKLKRPALSEDVVLPESERRALRLDRTPEERQALRYARAARVRWAILTNFERLILFDADRERVVLAFDAPHDYLARLDDLRLLAPADTPEQFDSRLAWFARQSEKAEIDLDFYQFLSEWRERLAQAIYDWDRKQPKPLFFPKGAHNGQPPTPEALDRLLSAVQRTLDRLIILRYADDVGALRQHDLLENVLAFYRGRLAYAEEYDLQTDLHRIYADFYRVHDTTLFAPGHLCEQVRLPNDLLESLLIELNGISFRKFSADILGNTYESYLGQRFTLKGDRLVPQERRDIRKGEGIYYTPTYVVRYIVDHTLGRWLYATQNGRPDGRPLPGGRRKTVADLDGLRVLDPAMGSGSFLIYAFDVLADFYEAENARIERENAARIDAWGKEMMQAGMFGREEDQVIPQPTLEQPISDYVERILQNHLYGVDLDPEAVEIAAVNLILRAFDRVRRNGRQHERKLPLILRQNLKVGNALIGAGADPLPAEHHKAITRLVALRAELRDLTDDDARQAKLAEIEATAAPLAEALNQPLAQYFDQPAAHRPFHWPVEFPEVFDPNLPEGARGFTIVVGNPPYVRIQHQTRDPGERRYLQEVFESSNRNYDVYVLFVERGWKLLARDGQLGYILPNKFFRLQYGENLRQMLSREKALSAILDFDANQLFPDQTTYTCLLFLGRDDQDTFEYHHVDLSPTDRLPTILQAPEVAPEVESATFAAADFGAGPWTFALGDGMALLSKMDSTGRPLSDFAEHIIVGIQTSADAVYILEERGPERAGLLPVFSRATNREHQLESAILKPLLSGQHVTRYGPPQTTQRLIFPYHLTDEGPQLIPPQTFARLYPNVWAYLRENEATLRGRERGKMDHEGWYAFGRHQNLDKQEYPKLLIPRLVERLSFAYDADGTFYMDNVDVNGIILREGVNVYSLLAVLNSRLINYVFSQRSVPFRGQWLSANRQFIEKLPIRLPDDPAQRDALATLAQKMLDLHRIQAAVARAFAETLRGYERASFSLAAAEGYWESKSYRGRHVLPDPLVDANEKGRVSAIAVDETDDTLLIRAQVDDQWRDVARLEIPHADFRRFLLLALRTFLREHRRKKVWSRGRVLRGVLKALEAPNLHPQDLSAADRNLARVERLMADLHRRLADEGVTTLAKTHGLDPLDLCAIETAIAAADREIDDRVFDLYNLTLKERELVRA